MSATVDTPAAKRTTTIIAPARFVKPPVFEALTGYTTEAINTKIKRGVWLEGFEVVRAPDGNIRLDMQGYERWAAGLPRAA